MSEEIRNLLGGYATGTLTVEERAALFEAALGDPVLFEALADEQVLRELLEDSAARAQLLQTVEDRRFSILSAFRDWFERPRAKLLTAVAGVLVVAAAITTLPQGERQEARQAAVLHDVGPPQASAPPQGEETIRSESAKSVRRRTPAASKKQAPAAHAPPKAEPQTPADDPRLRYAVLRLHQNGAYEPVPASYAFAPGDRARIRVESSIRGMLLVTSEDTSQTLFAGTISPDVPVLVPADITFTSSGEQSLQLALSPLPPVAVNASAPALARQPGGVAGGVPSGLTSPPSPTVQTSLRQLAPQMEPKAKLSTDGAMEARSAAVAERLQEPSTITKKILLHRK